MTCTVFDLLLLLLSVSEQGHSLDPSTASAALEALHQEGAWDVAGQVLTACVEGGGAVGPVAVQRLLLSASLAGSWKAVRHVLQVMSQQQPLGRP
jgi:hypothetical protein